MKKIWIVTNYGGGANYTPSVFTDEKEARNWMEECANSNVVNGDYSTEDVELSENQIVIGDPDDGGNILQIFEVEI